jgi:hypothetical protein
MPTPIAAITLAATAASGAQGTGELEPETVSAATPPTGTMVYLCPAGFSLSSFMELEVRVGVPVSLLSNQDFSRVVWV